MRSGAAGPPLKSETGRLRTEAAGSIQQSEVASVPNGTGQHQPGTGQRAPQPRTPALRTPAPQHPESRRYVRLVRSAMRMGRFSSTLFRAAMPVRQDIAPARESGTFR
jgi:hypothetical protein